MWRAVILLSFFIANVRQFSASTINRGFYTGGNYRDQQRPLLVADGLDYPGANYAPQKHYYIQEANEPQQPTLEQQLQRYDQLQKQHGRQQQERLSDEQKERYLQSIIEQLRGQRDAPDYERTDAEYPEAAALQPRSGEPFNEDESLSEMEELQRFTEKIRQLGSPSTMADASPELQLAEQQNGKTPTDFWLTSERPLSAQKKGQSEFVEFVEPHASKVLNDVEFMEKRVPFESSTRGNSHSRGAFGVFSINNNVFLAFLAICCIVAAVGLAGGTYYYYQVRSAREDPFDDFTRYSPAGPGRDRFKKNGGNSPLGSRVGEKGDDALAYKAQLHHYQQTKQKIIGDDGGVTGGVVGAPGADINDRSDDEDDGADLEHNFSVYECPGLAPTGDIEVQNPNFVEAVHK